MELGFVSAILPNANLGEVFSKAVRYGFDCVEVMCWPKGKADRRYAGITHVDVANLTDEDAHEICKMASDCNIRISGLGYYPNPLSPDEAESKTAIEHFLRVIEAAAKLEIHQANSFIGRDWKKSVDENWNRFVDIWSPIVEHAEKHQVKIGIENCPMLFSDDEWPGGKNMATSPSIWRRMFTDIPSPNFGLNYDPSHMIWQQMDYLAPLKEFANRIFHVHAKDVRLDHDRLDQVGILAHPLEYHTPKLPGMGEVNWGRFVSVLGDTGYVGPVCVEVEDRVFEVSDELRELSLKQSHDYLRNFIPSQRS